MATTLTAVSHNLFARKGDDRFASLPELLTSARARRDHSRELEGIPASALLFTPTEEGDPEPFALTIDHRTTADLPRVRLTNYSLSQLCTAARAPMELLQRVSRRTAAAVLNESIRSDRLDMSDRTLLLDTTDSSAPRLRASTSERYARVWDAEVFGRIEEWLAPVGYRPAMPTFSWGGGAAPTRDIFGDDRPALWSGDRDSFAFFYTEPDQNGAEFGGLRRGIYVGNSEVGAGALSWSTFFFRDMCANFLIWGAQGIKNRRVRHVGQTGRVFDLFCREVQHLARECEPLPMQVIARAAATAFAGDGSQTEQHKATAVERLHAQFGMAKGAAHDAVAAALLPQNAARKGEPALSFWTVANGVTWAAKDSDFASAIVDGGRVAERILAAAV